MNPRQFNEFVNRWCPPQFHHEDINNRLMRAFMSAVSCVDGYQRRDKGEPVFRPLDAYPNPAYPEGGIGL